MLEQEYKYVIPKHIGEMKDKEGQVLALLRNVRNDVVILNGKAAIAGLQDILDFVEKGEWIIPKKVDTELGFLDKDIEKRSRINYNINLSEAKQIIDNYRNDSEGGCQSCINIKSHYPVPNETSRYCKIFETEKTSDQEFSPMLEKYYKTGCKDKEPILKRKLEELLEGQG